MPCAHQLVVQAVEGALVARDDLGAEDHRVAGLEPDPLVLAAGDPHQGAARLALAAGAQEQRLVARHQLDLALVADRRDVLQVAAVARRIEHPAHRAADHEQLAAGGGPAIIADSMRATLEEKLVSTTRLGWPAISPVRLSRTSASEPEVPGESTLVLSHKIASTPSLPSGFQRRLVGPLADQRRRVELPVAGMEQLAERRVEHQRVGVRDRMGHVDEAAAEAADLETPRPARRCGSARRARNRSPTASRAARRR